MKKEKPILSHLYLIFIFIVMYLPILYLIIFSFSAGDSMTELTGFSFDHYRSLFEDYRLWTYVLNTLIIALLSALLATLIGTCGAITIYMIRKNKRKNQVLSMNNILMVMPDVMIGASFLILFSSLLSIKFGFFSVLLSHIAFNVPVVVLMILPRLYELNPSMFLAAEDLGASDGQILRHIILPNLSFGVLTGFFMALTYSLDDFAVTFFVTGSGFSTLSVEIYSRARRGIDLEINALSALMFLASLLMILGYYFIRMKEIKDSHRLEKGGHNEIYS